MLDNRPGISPRVTPGLALTLCLIGLITYASLAQAPPRAQVKVYPDTSFAAEALLKNAENHASGGQYAEAIEMYQRVIQQFSDKVVEVKKPPRDPKAPAQPPAKPGIAEIGPDDSKLFVDTRLDCQRRIAALPPEARALYRARVDSQAERWYKQGAANRDRALLRRVIEEAFCSSWGDDALELMGDISFQEGQFAEALTAYRQLVPDRSLEGQGLTHPDPTVDLARVGAKKLLARAALGGDATPTAADIAAFDKAFPNAKGDLAGRSGSYVTSVAEAITQDKLSLPAQPDGRWATFAGASTRTKIAPSPIDVGSLQWRVELTPITQSTPRFRGRMGGMNGNMGMGGGSQVSAERFLGYHPIVVGEQVVVCDEKSVTAYHLNQRPGGDGGAPTAVAAHAWRHEHGGFVSDANKPHHSLARYTLTAHGDRIYGRLGPPSPAPFGGGGGGFGMRNGGMGSGNAAANSFLFAIDRTTEGKVVWKRAASELVLPKGKGKAETPNKNAAFEGAPVADGRNVYVGLTDRAEMTSAYVACLDADTGLPRWVRYICEANPMTGPFGVDTGGEINHRLLTLDGPTLYYQTNLGAVVSLDVEVGAIRWMATYPTEPRRGFAQAPERDLNPAISYNGLVIVAPEDAAAIYAFDAATGQLVWKTRPLPEDVKLAHLLGVAKGRLVATGDRVLLFDVKTGALVSAWPDGGQSPQGYGRGILAGDKIYWPTKTEIHVLDQGTGLLAEQPIRLQQKFQTGGGNLAVGDGFLVVAQSDAMVVFCQLSRLIERYRDAIAQAPEQATNYYRLAQAAESAGQDELALTSLESVIKHARASELIDGLPLVESARDHQHRLLMRQAHVAEKAKDLATAIDLFTKAALAARNERDILKARLDLAEVQLLDGRAAMSVSTLQSLLADERLRPLIVTADDGRRSVRADLLIADRLAFVVREISRPAYAEFDRLAQNLLERGIKERDTRLLADVGRSYPVAKAVPEAYVALGQLYDSKKQPHEATRAYRQALSSDASDVIRGKVYLLLARAYEAQNLWQPAREAYGQIKSHYANQALDGGSKLGELANSRLAREPFAGMSAESAQPVLALPVERRWSRQWPATLKPLAAEGVPPSNDQGRIFLVEGNMLRATDPSTGEASWSVDMGNDPIWVGYLSDRLIAATRTKLAALNLVTGAFDWQFDLANATKGAPNPFIRADAAEAQKESASGQFSEIRIVRNRVLCLRGDHTLMAFDGDTGQVDWSFTATAGRINPRLYVGEKRIVFQLRKPNAIVVLETSNGVVRREFTQGDVDEWPRDPLPIDDDSIVLVADRMTVALFDLKQGVNSWAFQESKEMPKYGPPRIFGDSDRLFLVHNGIELIQLNRTTGKKIWSKPLGDEDLSERPEAFALGGDKVFVANGSDLKAYAVGDGNIVWRQKLIGPSLGWSLFLTSDCVSSYPNPARLSEEDLGGVLPIVFRRRDDGHLVQRLMFPTPVSQLAIRVAPLGVFVATQSGLWALSDRREVVQAGR
jgi:outer membrane protein assembly factor BamB